MAPAAPNAQRAQNAATKRVAILAGGGSLPREIANHLAARGVPIHIVALEGEADAIPHGVPQTQVNWGEIGALLKAVRDAKSTHVVFAGSVRRPDLGRIKPDFGLVAAIPHILRIISAGGDDAVLRAVMRFFEEKGLALLGPAEAAPELLVNEGVLGAREPSSQALDDARIGFDLIEAIGPFDIGQAVIIHDGKVMAIEGAEGTDRMLERFARIRRRQAILQRGGVLVKRPKPGQELRIDLPAIGPGTVERAAEAGLAGIAVMAGGVISVERQLMIARADIEQIFVAGVIPPVQEQADGDGPWQDITLSKVQGRSPGGSLSADMKKGVGVVSALTPFQSGDGAVVVRGHVLAVESGEGLSRLLQRSRGLRQWGDKRWQWRNGALAVRDPEAIDEEVVNMVQTAGLAGVVTLGQDEKGLRQTLARTKTRRLAWASAGLATNNAKQKIQVPRSATRSEHKKHARPLRLFLVAGEHSGDVLGGKLMAAINSLASEPATFNGVGDHDMAEHGLRSLFPLSDVAVMGPMNILPKLPRIVRRVHATVDAALADNPDAVVIIDSPEFTHPIAKRIRRRQPDIPIIDYVSPSVWAWRPGRAAKMKPYVDHLLALLPFEPEAHERLGGPPCTYVGHPLTERLDWLAGLDPEPLRERLQIEKDRPVLAVLPGSRTSEVTRLMGVFAETVTTLRAQGHDFDVVIPVVPSVRNLVETHAATWPKRPILVEGHDDKFRTFKLARAALAASGTVTLELAVAGTPMVVAYRVDAVAARLRFLLKVHSVVLANLVLGENAFPEFLQEECTPEHLSAALAEIMRDGTVRDHQLEALRRVPEIMRVTTAESPSEKAAKIVLEFARARKNRVE